jgi:hypothetical protein
MKLTRLAGKCEDPDFCHAIDLTDHETLIFTGPVVADDKLRRGPDEQSIELTVDLVKEAMRVLDAG